MRNVELGRCFRDLAAYLDMEDVPFKPRAYEKAALAIESHDQPLEEVYRQGGVKALRAIPGIGASMAEKVLPMPDDVQVLPGHGPVTTVGHERRTNPFLLELQADTGAAPSGLWTPS